MSNTGQRVGYVRVSSLGQCTDRQLDGVPLDQTFTDRCSGKDTNRPALIALLNHVRAGETMVCHSLDRLARNLTDLRRLVTDLTDRGVRVEFAKENLAFTGGDSPLQVGERDKLGEARGGRRLARAAAGIPASPTLLIDKHCLRDLPQFVPLS